MSVLITGGTGGIGAGLAHELIARGKDVVLFDIAPQMQRLADIKDKVKIVQGDLKVFPEVLNAVRDNNVDEIFHHGGMMSIPSDLNPWAAFQVNVMGSMHVLEAARLFGVRRFIFASTDATYGLGTGQVIDDATLQRPITMYGAGKLYIELLGRFYRRKFGLDFRTVRYCMVMRPGAKIRSLPVFMLWMVENAALGQPFECFAAENVAVPVIYYKDAVRATIMLYEAPAEKIKTVCYNLSGISPTPTAGALEKAIKKFIPGAQITYNPDPLVMEYYRTRPVSTIDDTRAREEWGWKPEFTDVQKVVADFIEEVKGRPDFWGVGIDDRR
ncbi:MAG: SDR family NAD(P)-dependent oxidoreductase [Dehalococcoidales bacterium]|nr:SDR family NAD(P)-dependent oxidoreductase [Dehalococcoidales bacterium]